MMDQRNRQIEAERETQMRATQEHREDEKRQKLMVRRYPRS